MFSHRPNYAALWLAAMLLVGHRSPRSARSPHATLCGAGGFSRRQEFSLLDSLPALSPDLSELEAFKLTADASSKTNFDRSIWLSDSLGRVTFEFYSGRSRFDSTQFFLWMSDSVTATKILEASSAKYCGMYRWGSESATGQKS